ncbi:MAG: DMT family transporter [Proteobacteria bacterium]|nr:DMT family transporter [Pseudomonadota bacterium]
MSKPGEQAQGSFGDRPASDVVAGASWLIASAAGFTVMWVLARHLSAELHPVLIVFWRNAIGLCFLMVWLAQSGLGVLRTNNLPRLGVVAVCIYVATVCSFYALSLMPVAEVTSLSFSAPLFGTVLAAIVLKEPVGVRRWSATVIGFCGALILLRPGYAVFSHVALIVMVSALLSALTIITVRDLSATESNATITIVPSMMITGLAFLGALPFWTWPGSNAWPLLVLAGIAGSTGMFCFNRAFRAAEASVVAPFDYARLIFAAILGYVIFGEIPDRWTWAGATVIFAAALYTLHRERRVRRNAERAGATTAPEG